MERMKLIKIVSLMVIISFGFGFVLNFEDNNDNEKVEVSAEVKPIILTDNNFKKMISKGVVLVDFGAPWCGYCRRQEPDILSITQEYKGRVTVGKLNTDDNKVTAREYHIRSLPTLIIFKDGKVATRMTGQQTKQKIQEQLNVYL